MTRDDIIRMAQKARIAKHGLYWTCQQEELERFANLYKQQMIKAGWRQCAEGQSTTQFCALLEEAVKAEREACAKICDDIDAEYEGEDVLATWCADAIRARGDK